MSKLKTLIKMELEMHVPVPVVELFFVLIVAYSMLSFGTASFNSSYQGSISSTDLLNIVNPFAFNLLRNTTTTVFFLNAIALSMFVSMSLAGDFSNGFVETILSYPIGRTEFILSKFILFSAISIMSTIVALLVGVLLSPLTYSFWIILLFVIIVIGKSFLIVSSSLLSALLLKKTIPSAMALIFFWFVLSFFGSLIPTPYRYVFFPEDVVLVQDVWTNAFLGLVGIFAVSIGILLIMILYFRRLSITRDQI